MTGVLAAACTQSSWPEAAVAIAGVAFLGLLAWLLSRS